MADLQLVDPKTNEYLTGRFAAVHREIDTTKLDVVGDLPRDLAGVYIRNGPNPKFPPLGSYTFPMEGDGMLHALWLENGEARYKNRFVRTRGMEAEERAGKAIFGGLMTPAFVDQSLLGPDPDPGWPTKLDAFINIVRHDGHWLALEEGTPAYEVSPELETIGRFDFDGGLAKGLTAHPKLDPRTGELVVFRYDVEAPFLTWAVVAPDGTMAHVETPIDGVDRSYMIHDFAVTERNIVIMLGPAVFDIDAMLTGGQVLEWMPELGTQFAVIPRDGSAPVTWIHADAMWVWHFANAYDDGDAVVLDFPGWNVPAFLAPGVDSGGAYTRATLRPTAGTVRFEVLHQRGTEFPRIDDRLLGTRHRYVTVSASSGRPDLTGSEHDVLCRVDLDTGEWVEQACDLSFGEVAFAPRTGGTDPLDGYYLAFGTGLDDGRSGLVVWDAATFPGPPRARVLTPQRIPNGLHGNWFPA
ncbi:MAG: carotenoid oxygenase family protein [Acidimicrobiia bacterium]